MALAWAIHPSSHACCPQSRAGEGSRPASLAAVLRTAPQAVPFSRRVELFRALLEEDKRYGGYSRTVAEGGVPPVKVCAGLRRCPDATRYPLCSVFVLIHSSLLSASIIVRIVLSRVSSQLTVKRATLMEDSFRGLSHLGSAMKARLSITFVNEQGLR